MNRKLFYIGNFLVLGAFIWACLVDADREWKDYQKAYTKLEVERLTGEFGADSDQVKEAGRRPIALKQLMNDFNRFDRCITCHQGFDPMTNPSLTTPYAEHPYKASPIEAHKLHDITKFGCTVCHGGQGLATRVSDAHGHVRHWEEPMLAMPYMQGACVKCHGDFKDLKGTEVAAKGKQIMDRVGCVGCHPFNGVGGEIGVDLGDIADKPVSRIDWSHMGHVDSHEWNAKEWIEAHFTKDPMDLVPGDPFARNCAPKQKCEPIPPSGMPPFVDEFSAEDAQAVTTYLLGQTDKSVPREYYRFAAKEKAPAIAEASVRGKLVFRKFGCAACHGEDGAKGRRNFNALNAGQDKTEMDSISEMAKGIVPTLTTIVGTYTRDELREKIEDGVAPDAITKFNPEGPVPPLYMPAWKEKIHGREMEDLITYLLSTAVVDDDDW